MSPARLGLSRLERLKLLTAGAKSLKPAAGRAGWSLPGQEEMEILAKGAATLGIADPFFHMHEGIAGARSTIGNRSYINFSSYDYLGLNGHPEIADRVAEAVRQYGTTVSASRMVSGERPFHRELELALAAWHGAEDCVVMVSGHATNVTTLAQLMRPGDLIVYDALAHNSVLQGAMLSGARRVAFRHNEVDSARELLWMHRRAHKRALLVLEGLYSMDGDVPDLAAFTALAREFDCWTMVDEAHATGVLGATGRGSGEHCGIDPGEVDLWMGTLSKSLVSSGGYIAGRAEVVQYLKRSAPGFVYSVGLAPPAAAAALAALELLRQEPWRVAKLAANASLLRDCLRAAGLDTGNSGGHAIVPVLTGGSVTAGRLAEALFREGINVQPIIHPAVAERAARLRFFVGANHTEEQLRETAEVLKQEKAKLPA
jgi:8-amino-7-oxononanoate synthase